MDLTQDAKLTWAIIGPGNIARDFIHDMTLVTECKNNVVAVMSNDLGEAEAFATAYHIPYFFNSIQKMLDLASPDIVYISTPHAAHFSQALECLQRHIAVLCEKPMTLNLEQVTALIETSKANRTFLMEGMWIRFLPSIGQVLELLRHNMIGEINSIVADMSYLAPEDAENRFYNPELGGGSLLDLGIYPVYLALLILGLPRLIKTTSLLSSDGIDKSCAIIAEYADSAYAILESSIIKKTEKKAHIYGDKGCITILEPWNEKPAGILVSFYDGTSAKYPCEWEGRGFQFEIAEVIHCLSSHRIESDLHNHMESFRLIGLLDEIRSQAKIVYPSYE
jgi:predicted dehydrogenase